MENKKEKWYRYKNLVLSDTQVLNTNHMTVYPEKNGKYPAGNEYMTKQEILESSNPVPPLEKINEQ